MQTFSTFTSEDDWKNARIGAIKLLSEAGALSVVFRGKIGQEDRVFKVLVPEQSELQYQNYESDAQREAQIGMLVSRNNVGAPMSFVQTFNLIKAYEVLPSMKSVLVKNENYNAFLGWQGDDSFVYILVQEFVQTKMDLFTWMKSNKMTDEIIRAVIFQLVYGLAVVNSTLGFQHNDIKTENIIVAEILTSQDERKYVIDGDLFKMKFPKNTPLVKFIDFGGSTLYIDRDLYPYGATYIHTDPLPLHILAQKTTLESNDYMLKRTNVSDMMAIFSVGLTMIAHNKWIPKGETQPWNFFDHMNQKAEVVAYEDDSITDVDNLTLLRDYLVGKSKLAGFDLDDLTLTSLYQILLLRRELKMTDQIPFDDNLTLNANKILAAVSYKPFEKEIYEQMDGEDKDFHTGLRAILDEKPYRLSFFKRLFAATPTQLREFGAPGTQGAFASALYHPYFARDFYALAGVTPEAYPGAESVKTLIIEPLALQTKEQEAVLHRRAEIEKLIASYQKELPVPDVQITKAQKVQKQKAQAKSAKDSRDETEKLLEQKRQLLQQQQKKLDELKEKEKEKEQERDEEQEKLDDDPTDDEQREIVNKLVEEEEELEKEREDEEEKVAQTQNEIEEEESDLEEEKEEVEREDDELVEEEEQGYDSRDNIRSQLKECFQQMSQPLNVDVATQQAKKRDFSVFFEITGEDNDVIVGCMDDVINLIAYTNVVEYTPEEQTDYDIHVNEYDGVEPLFTKTGERFEWGPEIFQSQRKFTAWKFQRLAAIMSYFVGSFYLYLSNKPVDMKKNADQAKKLSIITNKENWSKTEKTIISDIRSQFAELFETEEQEQEEEEEEKGEEQEQEQKEKRNLAKDLLQLNRAIDVYKEMLANFKTYQQNEADFDKVEKEITQTIVYDVLQEKDVTDKQNDLFLTLSEIPDLFEYTGPGISVPIENSFRQWSSFQWLMKKYAAVYLGLTQTVYDILADKITLEEVEKRKNILDTLMTKATTKKVFDAEWGKSKDLFGV